MATLLLAFLILNPTHLLMGHQLDVAPPAVCVGMLQRDISQVFKNVFDSLESFRKFLHTFAYLQINC